MPRPKERKNQKRRRKISIEMTSFITQPTTVQRPALIRPMHRKERDPKLGNSSGTRPAPIESTPIVNQRPDSFMYRLGLDPFNPWTGIGHATPPSLHMYGALCSVRGGVCIIPLGDGPAEGPPKIKNSRLALHTRFDGAVYSSIDSMERDPFSPGVVTGQIGRDQGRLAVVCFWARNLANERCSSEVEMARASAECRHELGIEMS